MTSSEARGVKRCFSDAPQCPFSVYGRMLNKISGTLSMIVARYTGV